MSRRRYESYGSWAPYVPVAQRRSQAAREQAKMIGKGQKIEPVKISGRKIASSFWGKGWCDHLESFGDISNRLPRGRTYVRNGSVCHLSISKGNVVAIVSGSSLYNVIVKVKPLEERVWEQLKARCLGGIASLVELLSGKLSSEIMGIVASREGGLFPLRGQITYTCDCPDGARMCKHVSAVMYGIGARLDQSPDALFLLRGVDHEELITAEAAVESIAGSGSSRARRRSLSSTDIANVFDVELEQSTTDEPAVEKRPRAAKKKTARKKAAKKKSARKNAKQFLPTARSIAQLRRRHSMSKIQFSEAVGVSSATISNWENARGGIRLRESSRLGLYKLFEQKPA